MRHRAVAAIAVAAIAVAALAVASAPARNSATSVEGVSSLSYAPKPFYDDLSRMRVRFTTTGRARRGSEYVVWLTILGPDASAGSRCTSSVVSTISSMVVKPQHIVGGPGKTNTVWLKADYLPTLSKYF